STGFPGIRSRRYSGSTPKPAGWRLPCLPLRPAREKAVVMIGAVIGILAIVVFVTAHEAGHFLAAKATGMKATEFFFGFGPKLWSFRRGETEYGIKAIPAGGYVRIIGMNPFEEVA